MSVTLDHTVVACSDSEAAARRFAGIMGLEMGEREGVHGKFVSVRVRRGRFNVRLDPVSTAPKRHPLRQ